LNQNEVYFSVDVETSGPIPGEYSLLSLGACRVDDPSITTYIEFRPLNDRAVPEALAVSGFDLAGLNKTGIDPAQGMKSFENWIMANLDRRTPVFVGLNASFDWSFVNWYFHKFLGGNPFGFSALDIKAYYMGLTGSSWEDTKSSRMPEVLKPDHSNRRVHNALSDAVYQADILNRMFSQRKQLLKS
jgi:DNA polymerase III epsilon subunit-like protein